MSPNFDKLSNMQGCQTCIFLTFFKKLCFFLQYWRKNYYRIYAIYLFIFSNLEKVFWTNTVFSMLSFSNNTFFSNIITNFGKNAFKNLEFAAFSLKIRLFKKIVASSALVFINFHWQTCKIFRFFFLSAKFVWSRFQLMQLYWLIRRRIYRKENLFAKNVGKDAPQLPRLKHICGNVFILFYV